MDLFASPIGSLLKTIIEEAHAQEKRKHEEKMAEIKLIANSELRDSYAEQILLDKFLYPVEKAQHDLQNAAKHAQYMAESINYHYRHHGLTKEQGRDISAQFRFLAVKITQIDSLHDLKLIYEATTFFAHRLSESKHHDCKYSMENAVRKHILDKLGTCIAIENNFQRRLSFMDRNTNNNRTTNSSPTR